MCLGSGWCITTMVCWWHNSNRKMRWKLALLMRSPTSTTSALVSISAVPTFGTHQSTDYCAIFLVGTNFVVRYNKTMTTQKNNSFCRCSLNSVSKCGMGMVCCCIENLIYIFIKNKRLTILKSGVGKRFGFVKKGHLVDTRRFCAAWSYKNFTMAFLREQNNRPWL